MNPFTEEQEKRLYMIGLDVKRMTPDEKKEIHAEIMGGKCRLDGDEIILQGCPAVEDRVNRLVRHLLKKKGISLSVISSLRIRPSGDSYTMTIEYRDSEASKGVNGQEKEKEWNAETYLEHVVFSQEDAAIKARLMETIGVSLSEMRQGMMRALEPLRQERKECTSTQKQEWISCKGGCETVAKQAIQQEITSTAYLLRCLAQSLLTLEGVSRIEFSLDGSPSDLTGRWNEDQRRIHLVGYGSKDIPGRLVMGFGPSASGKTYLTKTLLTLLRKGDPSLPPVFLTIDGGEYRTSSYTYDLVKKVAAAICATGFSNLVSAGLSIGAGSIFESSHIKKSISSFLGHQSLPIHLYVPETLGSCLIGSCEGDYRKYKEITKDSNWIGLLIWQHKTGKDCTFPSGYQCVGCTESGTAREKSEGKKYSSDAWSNSMEKGEAEFMKAPGGSYKIHNSGGKPGSTSVILDYSKEITDKKREIFRTLQGSLYLTNDDVQRSIKQFEREASGLKERVSAFEKAVITEEEKKEAKQALQQEYERLLRQSKEPRHGIYRALYPNQLVKSDRAMEDVAGKTASFVTDAAAWEKKHDTLEVKVYYIRHGYSCANAERNQRTGLKTPWSHTMVADPSLHPKGIKQAQALGEDLGRYVANGGPIDGFFTSQLYRAIQTGLLLRQVSGSNQIPLHVVPHICEVGNPLSLDNNPSKIKEINKHTSVIEEAGPVHITTEWGYRDKSDIHKFVDGPLHDWLIQRRKESSNQKQFTVFIVAHSTLLHKAFGIKPDNCQLIPVTYSFTSSGFLLGTRRPTEEDIKAVKAQFPTPYSGTEYTVDSTKPTCQDACKDLEDVSKGLDVTRLLDIVNTCVQTKGKSD